MRVIKTVRYNEDAAQLIDYVKKTDRYKFLAGGITLILFAAGFITVALIFREDSPFFLGLGIALAALFAVSAALAVTVFILRQKFPFNAIADDEYVFIRKGLGYLQLHKTDFREIIYTSADGESSSATGNGVVKVECTDKSITLNIGGGNVKVYLKSARKLAYILIQTALNPKSGVNWGTAYESLPESKRSPGSF